MMPEDALDVVRAHDAILMGAVGDPSVPDHVSLWGLILDLRQRLDLWANLRPARLLEGSPLPACRSQPGRRRHAVRSREHRGRVRGRRRAGASHVAGRGGDRGRASSPGPASSGCSGTRSASGVAPRGGHERDEVQCLALRVRALGRGGGGGRCRASRDPLRTCARRRTGGPHGACPGEPRRGRRLEPVRGHPHGPRGRDPGRDGHGRERESRTGHGHAGAVRAGPRLCARHRRPGRSRTRPAPSGARRSCSSTSAKPRRRRR